MRFIMMNLLLFIALPLHADIYKCTKSDGSIYYYERNCIASDQPQEITKRDLVLMRFEMQQKHQDIVKQQKLKIREELIAEKQQARAQRQRLRLEAKCETVRRQIDQLNKQYKRGYTVKQGQTLNRKLAECNDKRRIYCKQ